MNRLYREYDIQEELQVAFLIAKIAPRKMTNATLKLGRPPNSQATELTLSSMISVLDMNGQRKDIG